MFTKKYTDAEIRQNPFMVDVRVLFNNSNIDVLHIELEPAKMLSPVSIDKDAFFYIIEGYPELIINDEKKIAEPDMLVYCKGGNSHCINNPGKTKARILIFKFL